MVGLVRSNSHYTALCTIQHDSLSQHPLKYENQRPRGMNTNLTNSYLHTLYSQYLEYLPALGD
jgi:hypothetical protein